MRLSLIGHRTCARLKVITLTLRRESAAPKHDPGVRQGELSRAGGRRWRRESRLPQDLDALSQLCDAMGGS